MSAERQAFHRGAIVGRWTVVRPSSPAQRSGAMAARYYVRCACGAEKVVFAMDLRGKRTSGCRSKRCMNQHSERVQEAARDRSGDESCAVNNASSAPSVKP